MVSEKEILRMMVERLPLCPLCGSDSGYDVTSVIKGSVQCRSCQAEWSSLDFARLPRLEKLKIKELPHGAHSYAIGRRMLRCYDEYPISFWRSLRLFRPSEERKRKVSAPETSPPEVELPKPSALELLILATIIIFGGYFRLANLTEISSWHDYDEGVHSQAAILYIQGYVPYKDFFFAHPPLILYVLNVLYRFSGSNLGVGRMFSATLSTLTIIVVYLIGRTSRSPITGYIASAFVAFDGYTIYNSRKLMLEPTMTFFSCLSVLAYLHSIEKKDQRTKDGLILLSGVLMGLSISAKMAAVFNWAPLSIYLILKRDKRALSLFLLSSIASVGILLTPFLALTQGEVLKEIAVFQVLRPSDGTPRNERLWWMVTNEPDMIIVILGILSLMVMLPTYMALIYLRIRGKTINSISESNVAISILWALSVLFMFLSNKSFYGHYLEQIILPLALLIGSVATVVPRTLSILKEKAKIFTKALELVLIVGFALAIVQQLLIISAQRIPTWEDSWSRDIANELVGFTSPKDKILTFEPMFTFMAERTPAGLMCDSYGTMLYTGLGLHKQDLMTAIIRAFTERETGEWPMYDPRAQEYIVKLVGQSDYIILGDYRSDWQLTQETISQVLTHASLLSDFGGIRVYHIKS